MLRVYPVSRGASATITLELTAHDPNIAFVNKESSLLAVPGWAPPPPRDRDGDAYASYWPEHDESIGAAVPHATI